MDKTHKNSSTGTSSVKRRLPAEWESQAFVQFTFPQKDSDWAYLYDEVVACFVKIIQAAARFETVLVGCHDCDEVAVYFVGKTPYPIIFRSVKSNDTWTRDHGAITILEDQDPVLLDFTFNGWGNKFEATQDNEITKQLSKAVFSNSRIVQKDFVLEGGAIESDGEGTLLTTSECLLSPQRNPQYDQDQITDYLNEAFGVSNVLWLDHGYLSGDDTDSHIDTLARLCSTTTIAYVACDNPEDEHYDALKKMEAQLRTFKNAQGRPYHLVALPWPQACFDAEGTRLPATYANFLIVNGGVLVPTYQVPQDAEALRIIQALFPDRTVVGLDCLPLIDQHGSLHCITMQYPESVRLDASEIQ